MAREEARPPCRLSEGPCPAQAPGGPHGLPYLSDAGPRHGGRVQPCGRLRSGGADLTRKSRWGQGDEQRHPDVAAHPSLCAWGAPPPPMPVASLSQCWVLRAWPSLLSSSGGDPEHSTLSHLSRGDTSPASSSCPHLPLRTDPQSPQECHPGPELTPRFSMQHAPAELSYLSSFKTCSFLGVPSATPPAYPNQRPDVTPASFSSSLSPTSNW